MKPTSALLVAIAAFAVNPCPGAQSQPQDQPQDNVLAYHGDAGRSGNFTVPGATVETEGSGWICRYVAISFHRAKDRFSPGEAIECPDARLAVKRAELMMRNSKTVGAVAFSRRSNMQTGTVEAAEILRILGMIPDGFDIA
jgi:hypothetical protein